MNSHWSPSRNIEIVANTPPKGGTDRSARAFFAAIEANGLLDVSAAVVNKPGRTGTGWCDPEAAKGDAHRVGICTPSMTTDVLIGTLPDGMMRYTPIAILYTEYLAFVVDAASPLGNGDDFLKLSGGGTDKITVALATAYGNTNHIALAGVIKQAGGDVSAPDVRVFTSARLAIADVLEGNADMAVITAASAVPEMETGTVRTLAISSPARLEGVFADTPTWREQGVDCIDGSWRGIGGAHDLDDDQCAFWRGVCSAVVTTAEWKDAMQRNNWTHMYLDGDDLTSHLSEEYKETRHILCQLGMLAV